jgi:dienelactone hydrolase
MRSASLLLCAAIAAWADSRQPDARNIDPPNTNTHFKMPEYKTLAQWEARKKQLREQILFTAGLDPMPERPPVRSEIFGRIENKDYSIEKVLIETREGYWLGGNLYRPLGRTGKFPGIVSPHGHWNYGRLENTPTGSLPTRGINLARQGYVVLLYDMVGYNDTLQTPHAFGNKTEQLWNWGPLGLQLWNSIRAVDFLMTLPDVDPERIGATGASGGGTQTFLLAAVDERVKYAVPVNMISGIMQGGSPCENTPGLRVGAFNVEFGALMAPRPMLMVSATGDWTKNTLEEEYPAIKGIYELYDRASLVEAVRIDAPHNYNKDSREAMYRFFAKHALGDTDAAKYIEKPARIEPLQNMLALHGRALPVGALTYDGLFVQWRTIVMQQFDRLSGNLDEKRRLLRLAIGAEWPRELRATTDHDAVTLTRPYVKDRVPGIWLEGSSGQAALVVHPDGAAAARQSEDVAALLRAKRPVLMIDAFQTGQAKEPRKTDVPHFLTFNRTDDQLRVQDILTAMRWLEVKGHPEVELVGLGNASIWVRFAAAVAPVKVKLNAKPVFFNGADTEFVNQFFVPGIQRAGGWKTAMALTGGL